MDGWGIGEWAAFGSLASIVAGAIIGFVIFMVKSAFTSGRLAERNAQMEARINTLETDAKTAAGVAQAQDKALGLLSQALENIEGRIEETFKGFGDRLGNFEHDVRNLLTGKVRPATRTDADR